MKQHSFTDEQLLNLVNNTIKTKTEFKVEDFTGGSVQITSTNNHQLIKHKVSLFFGYNNRNAISKTLSIKEEFVSIWQHALLLKVKSLQVSNNGMDYSELNALMNNIETENKVVSKEVEVVSKGSTEERKINRTIPKEFTFLLDKLRQLSTTSKEYQDKLKDYIDNNNRGLSYQDFSDGCEMKGYKYKNFKLAYGKWTKDFKVPVVNKSNSYLKGHVIG